VRTDDGDHIAGFSLHTRHCTCSVVIATA